MENLWESSDPYDQFIGRWSQRVAPLFLKWLGIPPGRRWLDVGCGTGALSSTILATCSPSMVVGIEPSKGFLAMAARRLAGRAALQRASAMQIALRDASIDVVVSGLVLNFLPDDRAAVVEMARVAVGTGTIAAYVWDYPGKMELLVRFWKSAIELDPDASKLDEVTRFAKCRPDALADLFARAGLREVDVTPIDIPAQFESFDEYWRPFLGGQGPAPRYAVTLDDAGRERLRNHIRDRMPIARDGSISLIVRAWAVRGLT